jgi:hypothetical protein
MTISLITGLNSIQYVSVDNLLPNPENTLSKDIKFAGSVPILKCQKFLDSETIATQIKTNYLVGGGDTLTATLRDEAGTETALTVNLVASFTDELDNGRISAFYQFDVVGQPVGKYTIEIKGVFDGDAKYKHTEPFELVQGVDDFRYVSDDKFTYKTIPDHFQIVSSNIDNQQYTYWDGGFEVSIWVEGVIGKPQVGGEVDTYNNLGNETNLEDIPQIIDEIKTSDIPQYLATKIQMLIGLDMPFINDIQYAKKENGEIEYFGNYTGGVLTINLTQAFVEGINSGDQGFAIPTDGDMTPIEPLVLSNVSGAHQLVMSGGYTLNQVTGVRESGAGTTVTIKIGTTPGGNDVMRNEVFNDSRVIDNIARNFVNQTDQGAALTLYVDVSGVGASATVILQTIINKQ